MIAMQVWIIIITITKVQPIVITPTLILFPFVPMPIVENLSIDDLNMSNQDENDADNANAMKACHDRLKGIVNSSSFRERDASEGTKNKVSFSSVSIEYSITIGEHPDCSKGVPIALD